MSDSWQHISHSNLAFSFPLALEELDEAKIEWLDDATGLTDDVDGCTAVEDDTILGPEVEEGGTAVELEGVADALYHS